MSRILLFLLCPEWTGVSRLPKALGDGGFEVVTLSHAGSFLAQTRHATQHVRMPEGANAGEFLLQTIAATRPDLVIGGCGAAVALMQRLAADDPEKCREMGREKSRGDNAPAVRTVLQRSLGHAAHYRDTLSKHRTIAIAQEEGIRVPAQAPVRAADNGIADVRAFAQQYGFPVVLKSEFGFGGGGVRICHDEAEVVAGIAALTGTRQPIAAPALMVQQHVSGALAMLAVSALAGDVLEQLGALKVECHPAPTGPSSVVRFIEHDGMERALVALVRRFGYTGFGSGDFILDADGQAWLIEFNARPTPICHLGADAGHDLARALWCRMAGTKYERRAPLAGRETVALFPQETIRDPASAWITTAFHDMPQDDPALLAALRSVARRGNPAAG